MPSTKAVYERGQQLGRHGIKYLQELEGVTRFDKVRGRLYTQRRALLLCGICNQEFCAYISDVKRGHTKSCKCKQLTSDGISCLPNGEKDPINSVWGSMIQRCYNPNRQDFNRYGGRGISVCSEWRESFKEFRNWAINNGYATGLQIDRRNNDGNYEPTNCRFLTNFENSRNKRNNKYCWLNGEKMIFTDAAIAIGVSRLTIGAWAKQPIDSKNFRKRPSNLVFEAKA